MSRLPAAVVGDAYASTFAWETLAELVDVGNRMAGQEGEAEGARILADAFEAADLREVRIEEFSIPGWWRGDSSLTVAGDRSYDAEHEILALPGAPSGSVEAPIVDAGYGSLEEFEQIDVERAIAMVSSESPPDADRWLHRMEKYAAAADAGAVGFVFHNHVEGCLPPTGEVGYHDRPGPIPAVGVSKEVGERLRRLDAPTAALDVDCRNGPAESRNVEAIVGPDTERELLLTAHVDAHDISEGASDNAAGCAIVAEIGRLLAGVDLETRVRLIAFGSEEIGLHGATHWASTHDLERVDCVINVDGTGTSRTLRVGTNGFTGLERTFEEVIDGMGAPIETDGTVSPHGDQWAFVQEGVPAAIAGTTSEGAGRGWGHTHADTLDKLDVRDLRAIAIQLAAVVVEAANGDRRFERRSCAEVRDALSAGYERELKRGGRWPYDG